MRKLILAILAVFICTGSYSAQNLNSNNITMWIRVSYDSEKITIDNTAGGVGFTSSLINPTCTNCPGTGRASAAVCTLETAEIRISTVIADPPTSSTGMLVPSGSSIAIYGYNDIAAFRGIRTGSTSGVLNCTYYR